MILLPSRLESDAVPTLNLYQNFTYHFTQSVNIELQKSIVEVSEHRKWNFTLFPNLHIYMTQWHTHAQVHTTTYDYMTSKEQINEQKASKPKLTSQNRNNLLNEQEFLPVHKLFKNSLDQLSHSRPNSTSRVKMDFAERWS